MDAFSENKDADQGRCYAYPDSCSVNDGTWCDLDIFYTDIDGDMPTCEHSDNPEDHCTESNQQHSCLQYSHCTTLYDMQTLEPTFCIGYLEPQIIDGVQAPDEIEGTDCYY